VAGWVAGGKLAGSGGVGVEFGAGVERAPEQVLAVSSEDMEGAMEAGQAPGWHGEAAGAGKQAAIGYRLAGVGCCDDEAVTAGGGTDG
jgi:hypothetical protein